MSHYCGVNWTEDGPACKSEPCAALPSEMKAFDAFERWFVGYVEYTGNPPAARDCCLWWNTQVSESPEVAK